MKHVVPITLICVIGWAASTARAGRFLPHPAHMTVPAKVAYFKRSVRKDQTAIAFLTSRHAPRTLERRSELGWYRAAIRWHTSLLRQYTSKLPPAWPPHHQLWLCISSGEANWSNRDTGHNGHYGGLQMHPGWGYGTSYYASDDSQMTQEWAAEHAYKASRYSPSFLWQQWAADARCFA